MTSETINTATPVAFVTGGSHGLGRALVKQLFRAGFSVYFTGRDQLALASLCDELGSLKQAEQLAGDYHSIVLDQSDLLAVAALEQQLAALPVIDVLVNNAGVIPKTPAATVQGFEYAFGVNYLAHVLLTAVLWEKLQAAAAARVINVSSLAFGNGVIDWQQPRVFPADGWQAYSNSKLALIVFNQALAARPATGKVTANSVCPGIVDSELLKNHPLFPPSLLARLQTAMKSADEAAEYLFWLATADELAPVSGRFFSRNQGGFAPLNLSLDGRLADQLWQQSLNWLAPFAPASVLARFAD